MTSSIFRAAVMSTVAVTGKMASSRGQTAIPLPSLAQRPPARRRARVGRERRGRAPLAAVPAAEDHLRRLKRRLGAVDIIPEQQGLPGDSVGCQRGPGVREDIRGHGLGDGGRGYR